MSRKDSPPGTGIGQGPAAAIQPGEAPPLSDHEKVILEILVSCKTSRTQAQLSSASGLGRGVVVGALESLREKGLVIGFNTLVESYAARFPGIEV